MKKIILGLFLVFSFVLSASAMTMDEAMQQSKPTVVMFKMQGCSACRAYEPTFDGISSKYSDKYNFLKEDVYTSSLSSHLNIQSVPTIVIIYPGTKKVYKVPQNVINQKPNGLEQILDKK